MASLTLLALIISVVHVVGVMCAIHSLLWTRSAQGAVAWLLALIVLPYLAVPLYFVFGRRHFRGYRKVRREILDLESAQVSKLREKYLIQAAAQHTKAHHKLLNPWEKIFSRPFIGSNRVTLLVDGRRTFNALLQEINLAREYVLFQFFIFRDDRIGREFIDCLINKAREGVRVYVLYDEIGSLSLSNAAIREMRENGVDIQPFYSRRGLLNKFQLNFRNHRKIAVIDGEVSFVGGHNIGDEYLGRNPDFGPWHDLHIRVEGPETAALQMTFLQDWAWATREALDLKWIPAKGPGSCKLLTIPSGPADNLENCTMMFLHAINSAEKRVWISSPYFVPDDSILIGLQLAARRGVDVRVLLPQRPDHLLVWLAAFSYIPELIRAGARVFSYTNGFLHAKAFIVDDYLSMVGTPNLDNRSFRLNFEVATLIFDSAFCADLSKVLKRDFAQSEQETQETIDDWSLARRILCRLARLLSPIL